MKISVITPTYNSATTVAGTVNSILEQNYTNFEHIIIDNLSTDETLTKITELYSSSGNIEKLKIFSEPDDGISDAFNKGIANATGEIITILNSDDIYYCDKVFDIVIETFSTNKNISFLHGDIIFEDQKYGTNLRQPLLCNPAEAMPFNHPTMFVNKEIYKSAGVFDVNNRYCMDYEFVLRLYKFFPDYYQNAFYFTKFPLVVMRAGGISWKHETKMLNEMVIVLKDKGLFSLEAQKVINARKMRVKIKKVLAFLGLERIVKFWRDKKWN